MLQNTPSLWVFICMAGLLCFGVSWMLVMVKKATTMAFRLLAGGLFCLSLWSFEYSLGQILPGYFTGTILYVSIFALFMFGGNRIKKSELKAEEDVSPESITEIAEKAAPQRPCLSIEQSLRYKKLIAEHLSSSLAFRRPGYTIRDLASETGIPGYMISMFINQEYEMNFNELINVYRVEYLAQVFNTSFDYKTYTLEALGKMAGFNSRTAFIASIKKHTGMTPSAFFGRKPGENVIPVIFKVPELVRDVA